MVTTLMTRTPATGLSCFVVSAHSAHTAPDRTEQGTGLPSAGISGTPNTAQVAFGARVLALPGLPARGAPV